jgi:uncharacterized membrane protein
MEDGAMSIPDSENPGDPIEEKALPFVAPCRKLTLAAPLGWIKLGWQDVKRAPAQSLAYGILMVLVSYLLSFLAYELGSYILLLSLLSGFVFIGPALAMGMYDISCQLARGRVPSFGHCLLTSKRNLGNEMVFSVILLIVFLVWARAASTLHIFFPAESDARWTEFLVFLGVGSAVGSIFAAIVFSTSAFALPMIMDRRVDVITAVVTSVNAVLSNKGPMLVWAAIILLFVALGFATAFIGLAVLLPLIGHATWHAYREAIDSGAWPAQDDADQETRASTHS